MLKQTWFGLPAQETFPGYNIGKGFTFPYWSAPAITYAMAMLAYSKILVLEESHN